MERFSQLKVRNFKIDPDTLPRKEINQLKGSRYRSTEVVSIAEFSNSLGKLIGGVRGVKVGGG